VLGCQSDTLCFSMQTVVTKAELNPVVQSDFRDRT